MTSVGSESVGIGLFSSTLSFSYIYVLSENTLPSNLVLIAQKDYDCIMCNFCLFPKEKLKEYTCRKAFVS